MSVPITLVFFAPLHVIFSERHDVGPLFSITTSSILNFLLFLSPCFFTLFGHVSGKFAVITSNIVGLMLLIPLLIYSIKSGARQEKRTKQLFDMGVFDLEFIHKGRAYKAQVADLDNLSETEKGKYAERDSSFIVHLSSWNQHRTLQVFQDNNFDWKSDISDEQFDDSIIPAIGAEIDRILRRVNRRFE